MTVVYSELRTDISRIFMNVTVNGRLAPVLRVKIRYVFIWQDCCTILADVGMRDVYVEFCKNGVHNCVLNT